MENSAWEQLSEYRNNDALNGPNKIICCDVKPEMRMKPFRFVKFAQVDVNWANTLYLSFATFWLFGELASCDPDD
jgi:hypothetical protein